LDLLKIASQLGYKIFLWQSLPDSVSKAKVSLLHHETNSTNAYSYLDSFGYLQKITTPI